jgi:cell division protein FtsI/penicillin-binding protein 2
MLKIHIYYARNGKIKRAEICDGVMTVKLDPKRDIIIDKNGKPIAFRNPLFNITLPLHSYYVIIHHQ